VIAPPIRVAICANGISQAASRVQYGDVARAAHGGPVTVISAPSAAGRSTQRAVQAPTKASVATVTPSTAARAAF
jgi:hypothetical protein